MTVSPLSYLCVFWVIVEAMNVRTSYVETSTLYFFFVLFSNFIIKFSCKNLNLNVSKQTLVLLFLLIFNSVLTMVFKVLS